MMQVIQIKILMLFFLLALAPAAFGATVFSDDFSTNGTLGGTSADIGGTWVAGSGALVVSGGVVDTAASNTSSFDTAGAAMTQVLGTGEQITLTFVTAESAGDFATVGWVGVSLYVGGSEKVFMGSPGFPTTEWGIAGSVPGSNTTFATSITAEPQTAVFDYDFDSGDWSFSVDGQTLNGTATAGLAFDQVGIGSDRDNIADMAVSSINITITPEPATMSLLALGGIAMLKRRKR